MELIQSIVYHYQVQLNTTDTVSKNSDGVVEIKIQDVSTKLKKNFNPMQTYNALIVSSSSFNVKTNMEVSINFRKQLKSSPIQSVRLNYMSHILAR